MTKTKLVLTILNICFVFYTQAQIEASNLTDRQEAVKIKQALQENSIFKEYPIRNIGPTIMGGRVVDIAVNEQNTKEYYVAYASAGVFKTENNGLSFEPIFDNQARITIGDIALHPQNSKILWVGTGENNSSRSSYAGFGVYKSTDAGKNWQHLGLENTQHIGRIILHPTDEDVAWVASLGALYSKNKERGIYKTKDGGKTWTKTLFVNDSTGVIDMLINPKNPQQLWAVSWERSRKSSEFQENGSGSALYVSNDGGETWTKSMQGLPESQFLGRMGLDICQSKPNILYLVVDNQREVKKAKEAEENKFSFKMQDFKTMSESKFMQLDNKELEEFLREKGYPRKYTAELVKQDIKAEKYKVSDLATYFKNANNDLFETEVIGAELYRSEDFGKTWQKVNSYDLEGLFYTYGYYFGQVRVNPQNPEELYILGVPMLKSEDGGKTFKVSANPLKVHADHHALWINPKDPKHILNGNDGGVYVSYDAGEKFLHLNNTSVGQFYTVAVDMEKPYNVYGGLQDNGTFKGSSKSVPNESKEWERLFGGDGMFVAVEPENSSTVYVGYQFGNYYRLEQGKRAKYMTPRHDLGEKPLRFNWRTPVMMSQHNSSILYMGANKVYRTLDKGNTWEAISEDLTNDLPQGNVPFSTISSLVESPLEFGLLYAGTDDGNVWILDSGKWTKISENLPQKLWVSSIFPSPHNENEVFVSLNAYREDNLETYIYHSANKGNTWTKLQGNLPKEAVNVIAQDAVNPDLLYLGTDEGAYISLDKGKTWEVITGDFPNVATYDLIVHPREHELVLATHGRSMYVLDAKPLQKIAGNKAQNAIVAFEAKKIRFSENWGKQDIQYLPKNEPKAEILYYIGKENKKKLKISVLDEAGNLVKTLAGTNRKGFHQTTWDLTDQQNEYIQKGIYEVLFSVGKDSDRVSLGVE